MLFLPSLLFAVTISSLPSIQSTYITLDNSGDHIYYDGTYYSYRAKDGIKQINMWVPPGKSPIQGVFIHGNPGLFGDSRWIPRDQNLQIFAARYNFAILGVTAFPGKDIYPDGAKQIIDVLKHWSKLGFHPELQNVPFIPRGSSNGGITAYSFAAYTPKRTLCLTSNVGPVYYPKQPNQEMLKIPALFHVAEKDEFFPNGIKDTKDLMQYARKHGALWAWLAEKDKRHEIGNIDEIDMRFYEECIKRRLHPKTKKLSLISESSGWLVDHPYSNNGLPTVGTYKQRKKNKTKLGWVFSEEIARLYQGVTSHRHPIKLFFKNIVRPHNSKESGVFLGSKANKSIPPGSTLELNCDIHNLNWTQIDIYQNGQKITNQSNNSCNQTITAPKDTPILSFVAVGRMHNGKTYTSIPTHVLIEDSALVQKTKNRETRPVKQSSKLFYKPKLLVAQSNPSGLISYRISEKQKSNPWTNLTKKHKKFILSKNEHEIQTDNSFSSKHNTQVVVSSVYDRNYLYFHMQIEDDQWAPAKALHDTVDFHVALYSPSQLEKLPPEKIYVTALLSSQLLLATQLQSPVGFCTHNMLQRTYTNPWDLVEERLSYQESQKLYDIVLSLDHSPSDKRTFQAKIPWSIVSNNVIKEAPAPNSIIAVALGYNDHDPSVTKQEGVDKLRWPNKTDPWLVPSVELSKTNLPWGQLILAESL